ncbi:lichenan operon transcriptional antiterminator [Paenibacillus turicensis]|uniref:Lichenan operon transcriptional antiterminator n=1 Tax=Paenibacillus turicensis TaxID=160487 RepID=A0ABS4FVM8_9BACL|nr:BglG family transcription antiterminator [Paenibacillus turicensis]MBP1906524.1 lichenan operon transcriptional antiterminator [Paenibacillus turicensis]
MNSRMIAILQHLLAADGPLKSEHLAKLIQVTSRTVRSDIRELEGILDQYGASIQPVRARGYELKIIDQDRFCILQEKLSLGHPAQDSNSPQYRYNYLIRRLLLAETYVKLEELADELYVSKSTVQNDLKEVKQTLTKYGILIDKRPNYGIKLKGDEVHLRFCISEFIMNRLGDGLDQKQREDIYSDLKIVSSVEMELIRNIIMEQIQELGVNLSDAAFNNLANHIAISCRRIREGNQVTVSPDDRNEIALIEVIEAAGQIVERIGKALQLSFSMDEVVYIAMHLSGNKWFSGKGDSIEIRRDSEIRSDDENYALVKDILVKIDRDLALKISNDQELIMGLCLHLKPALNRVKYGMSIRNPMLEHVKSNYPFAFQAGVIMAKLIESKLGVVLPEAEMGYLAIHIGAAIERQRMNSTPKRCLVVCTSGMGSARLLYYKLRSKFGERLEVVGTTELYKLNTFSLTNIDFVVSTVPIVQPLAVPIIVVEKLLGGEDMDKINTLLNDGESYQFDYIIEKLVFLKQNFTTKEQVITFLGNKMQEYGLIRSSEGFIGLVLERENAAPTSYGNLVAIPHPIIPQSNCTVWVICTLSKPIDWSGRPVQFVCLLSIDKSGEEPNSNMYQHLMGLVDDTEVVQNILRCNTYHEFAQMIVKHKLY